MKYDFDKTIDRLNTASYKWDQSEKLFGDKDIIPMWVADMDFMSPLPVVEAIKARAAHGIYGYTIKQQSYYDAITGWLQRRHQWDVKQEWISSCPGIVPALSIIVQAFTEPGDKVIVQSPVYYPFYDVISMNGRNVVNNPLTIEEGSYRMDFDDLERQIDAKVKLLLLCSPHNPGGRVWTREELARLGEICLKHNILIVSDEIHCDLVYKGHKHIPLASISTELAQHSITCVAPSKTFNLAGLQTSSIIIPNSEMRQTFNSRLKTLSLHLESYFGVTATEAAYNYGEEWLDQLVVYLEDNVAYVMDYMETHVTSIKVMKPEGTYLVWLDCRALGMDVPALKQLMYKEAGVAFNEGSVFGHNGQGFLRMNIACPRSLLEQGLQKFHQAVNRYKSN